MKNTFIIFIISLLFITPNLISAQGETDNWFMHGDYWMKFDNDSIEFVYPPPGSCGSWSQAYCDFFRTSTCASSISDSEGNLIMYTNCEVLWNASLDTMLYGQYLLGNDESSQSLIIPRPGHSERYYVITTDYVFTTTGTHYTEIDLTMDGGLGGLIIPINTLLLSPSCQKITAVYHSNGKDIWLLAHEYYSNAFHAFLVTSNGIGASAIISNVGTIHQESYPVGGINDQSSAGEMKFSTNGKRLAVAIKGLDIFEIFDFDNQTGIVSNPISFQIDAPESVEFSPDGNLAYVGNNSFFIFSMDSVNIFQIDLLAGDSIDIMNSYTPINSNGTTQGYHYLQLGIDGKIYNVSASSESTDHLSVIQSPNTPGINCNWDYNAITVPSNYCGSNGPQTLPNFFRSHLDRNIVFENTCYGDSTLLYTLINTNFDSIRWEFEDVTAGLVFSILNQDSVYHVFSEPGSYEIVLKRYRNGYLDEDNRMLYIKPVVDVYLGNDTTICEGSELEIQLNDTFSQFAWVNDFSTDTLFSDTVNILEQGNWWPVITNFDEYCGNLDTIYVNIHYDSLSLGNDTAGVCLTSPLTLDATLDSATYLWSTGETTASIIATISNYYIVEAIQGYCTFTDTIHILYDEPLIIDLPDTSIVCDSIPIELSVIDILADYLWSPTGETTPEILVTNPGIYSVTASNGCGEFIDSTTVLSLPSPVVNLGNDTIICSTDSILLDASNWLLSGAEVYVWSDGSGDSSLWVSTPGQYFVTVTNDCGNAYDNILIETENPVFINLGNDTIICLGEELFITPEIIGEGLLQWSTGDTTQEIAVTDEGEYILSVTNVCGEFSDTLNLAIQINDFIFTEDTIFIHSGDSAILSGPDSTQSGVEVYEWSTGENTQNITVSNTGTFWLTFIDSIGCEATDSIIVSWYVTIAPISYLDNIKIFPNPTSNELIIDGLLENDEVRLFDVVGKEQPYKKLSNQPYILNLKNYQNGIYLLRIKRNNEVRIFKIIKQ